MAETAARQTRLVVGKRAPSSPHRPPGSGPSSEEQERARTEHGFEPKSVAGVGRAREWEQRRVAPLWPETEEGGRGVSVKWSATPAVYLIYPGIVFGVERASVLCTVRWEEFRDLPDRYTKKS